MGTGEPQVLAQELHQQGARVDVTGDGFAVHRHCDGGHVHYLLKSGAKCPAFASAGRPDRVKIARFCPAAWIGTSRL
jgi:hypothetical protein